MLVRSRRTWGVVLNLEPEETRGDLDAVPAFNDTARTNVLNRNNFGGSIFFNVHVYPPSYRSLDSDAKDKITQAVMEDWFWLERDGFLAPKPGPNHDTFFITRRGQRVRNAIDLAAIRKADLLPRKLLHPVIAEKTWSLFLRGEYDTAVFQAFKEVEVAVRDAGKFESTDIGTELMRRLLTGRKVRCETRIDQKPSGRR